MNTSVAAKRLTLAYVSAVALFGALALAYATATSPFRIDPVMVVLLGLIVGVAQRYPVFLFRSSAISVAFAGTIAAYVLYGPGVALWVNLVSAAVNAFTPKRKPLIKIAFNAGNLTLSAFAAAETYLLIGGRVPPAEIHTTIIAVAFSASLYFLVNTSLTALVISLTTGMKATAVWSQNYAWMSINYLATAINGAALALAYQSLSLFGTITFLLPLGVAWYSFKLYVVKSEEVRARNAQLTKSNELLTLANDRLEEAHLSIIGALTGALEAKDRYTHGHSSATMHHAVTVALEMGLSEDEITAVRLGALFHDIGKIGISESLLRKPGPLNDEEWREMRDHPAIGANLLGRVPALENVRPIVLAHHERYDGTGYPHGLKGDQIPAAAQVISVADTYESMTSTRPYRRALSHDAAIRELKAVAGTQLNPAIVSRFIEVIERQRTAAAERGEHAHDHDHTHAASPVTVTA
jgi:putative nucleotidyltransferase with HDIG domain